MSYMVAFDIDARPKRRYAAGKDLAERKYGEQGI